MGANGPLLASGGRGVNGTTEGTVGYPNDLFLWVSRDGMGLEWEKFSLTYLHNSLLPPKLASVHPAAIACKATHHPPGCVSSLPVLAPLNRVLLVPCRANASLYRFTPGVNHTATMEERETTACVAQPLLVCPPLAEREVCLGRFCVRQCQPSRECGLRLLQVHVGASRRVGYGGRGVIWADGVQSPGNIQSLDSWKQPPGERGLCDANQSHFHTLADAWLPSLDSRRAVGALI